MSPPIVPHLAHIIRLVQVTSTRGVSLPPKYLDKELICPKCATVCFPSCAPAGQCDPYRADNVEHFICRGISAVDWIRSVGCASSCFLPCAPPANTIHGSCGPYQWRGFRILIETSIGISHEWGTRSVPWANNDFSLPGPHPANTTHIVQIISIRRSPSPPNDPLLIADGDPICPICETVSPPCVPAGKRDPYRADRP